MKNRVKLVALSFVTSYMLVGCGSSSDSGVENNNLDTGYLMDSAVAGAEYNTTTENSVKLLISP